MSGDQPSRGRILLADVLEIQVAEVPLDASIDNFPNWDSLAHMRLVARLEQLLDRELESEEMLSLDSVVELDALLARVAA